MRKRQEIVEFSAVESGEGLSDARRRILPLVSPCDSHPSYDVRRSHVAAVKRPRGAPSLHSGGKRGTSSSKSIDRRLSGRPRRSRERNLLG